MERISYPYAYNRSTRGRKFGELENWITFSEMPKDDTDNNSLILFTVQLDYMEILTPFRMSNLKLLSATDWYQTI